jgi:hypothetical protein
MEIAERAQRPKMVPLAVTMMVVEVGQFQMMTQ